MSAVINVRIDTSLLRELDELAKMKHINRADTVRDLLIKGLERERMHLAAEEYLKGKLTLEQASHLAKVSIYDMMDYLDEMGISKPEDAEELRKNAEMILKDLK
jgi:predicted HTH domain antitoxin